MEDNNKDIKSEESNEPLNMNHLIPCPACGEDISGTASNCPKCGNARSVWERISPYQRKCWAAILGGLFGTAVFPPLIFISFAGFYYFFKSIKR